MKVSIIIPTLNEASRIARLVRALRAHEPACEIIVVDGGSSDRTCECARDAGALATASERGRGQQLCHGAGLATGDVLLFLHADTRLLPGAVDALRRHLADPGVVGGNFRVLFDGGTDFARWLTGFYAWFRKFGVYYGDSAMFVRRSVYEEIGGFRPVELMEDFDFARRLRRVGTTICIQEPPVITSSRRFEGRRAPAIVAGWLLIHALFYLRVKPAILARLYDSARRRQRRAQSAARGDFKKDSPAPR